MEPILNDLVIDYNLREKAYATNLPRINKKNLNSGNPIKIGKAITNLMQVCQYVPFDKKSELNQIKKIVQIFEIILLQNVTINENLPYFINSFIDTTDIALLSMIDILTVFPIYGKANPDINLLSTVDLKIILLNLFDYKELNYILSRLSTNVITTDIVEGYSRGRTIDIIKKALIYLNKNKLLRKYHINSIIFYTVSKNKYKTCKYLHNYLTEQHNYFTVNMWGGADEDLADLVYAD
jgi:hypothetical protein